VQFILKLHPITFKFHIIIYNLNYIELLIIFSILKVIIN